jgi:nucleotide-binding universal stress UspA family protein
MAPQMHFDAIDQIFEAANGAALYLLPENGRQFFPKAPIMLWPPQGTILVPIDFSEQSVVALDTALAVAGDPNRVRVVHVIYEVATAQPEFWEVNDRVAQAKAAEAALREMLQCDPKRSGVALSVCFGDPGHEIAGHAEKYGAGLIVMPSHGRRGVTRLLLGSVAERVLRLAHCPVLVLRGMKRQEKSQSK